MEWERESVRWVLSQNGTTHDVDIDSHAVNKCHWTSIGMLLSWRGGHQKRQFNGKGRMKRSPEHCRCRSERRCISAWAHFYWKSPQASEYQRPFYTGKPFLFSSFESILYKLLFEQKNAPAKEGFHQTMMSTLDLLDYNCFKSRKATQCCCCYDCISNTILSNGFFPISRDSFIAHKG